MDRGVVGGSPTVQLVIQVPAADGQGWSWQPADMQTAEEFAYTPRELERVLSAYGFTVAMVLLRVGNHPRFRVLARSLTTGQMLGTYGWVWDAERGRYSPEGEPWVLWPGKHYLSRQAAA